jgi:hypothetical protein
VLSENSNGTYMAKVSFQLPDGTWASKDVDAHTMFPDSWSKPEVVHAVEEAFNNKTMIGRKWYGQYNGVKIEGYVDANGDLITAFPAKAQ